MRILFVHRYFSPDRSPYGTMLGEITRTLAQSGHSVSVFTAWPQGIDDEVIEEAVRAEAAIEISVHRVRLKPEQKAQFGRRIANTVVFLIALAGYMMRRGRAIDRVVVGTFPPVVMAATVSLMCRVLRIPYTYHVQDIHPELSVVAGLAKPSVLTTALRRIDYSTSRHAATIIALSDDMEAALRDRGPIPSDLVVMNNFSVGLPGWATIPSGYEKPPGAFRVLFAGNLGRFQGLGQLIDSAELLAAQRDIEFVFVGGGGAEAELRRSVEERSLDSVRFLPYVNPHQALAVIATADIAVISLAPGVYRYAYPSKMTAYVQAGRPVLGIVEGESGLAREIADHNLGEAIEPGSPVAIAEAVLREQDRTDRDTTVIERYAASAFGIERGRSDWVDLADAWSHPPRPLRSRPGTSVEALAKRALDVIAGTIGLVASSPILGVAAVCVAVEDGLPVLFRQIRMGQDFVPFEVLKIRTMRRDAEVEGQLTVGDDGRATRIGKFLRRYKIDELPQLHNVIRGDMSLVGPRPEVPENVVQFMDDYAVILSMRPGITDTASIKYSAEAELLAAYDEPERAYESVILPDKIRLAQEYARSWTIGGDLRILGRTIRRLAGK